MREMSVQRIARIGVLIALAIALGWVERLIPMDHMLPGVKLGLANVVVMIALERYPWREAFLVALLRIVMSGLLFAAPSALIYSLSGGMLSLIVMTAAMRCRALSLIGVSALGAVAHNVGQWLAVLAVTQTLGVITYLPLLMVSGLITGVATGLMAVAVLRRLPKQIA